MAPNERLSRPEPGPPRPPSRRVAVVGMVPPGTSGVRDYGQGLVEELTRRGFDVEERWVVSDGQGLRRSLADGAEFLSAAWTIPARTPVVWNYSSFAYGVRGLPLTGVLFGLVRRARGGRVVTVAHEMGYRWGRRGWRGNVQTAAQWAAFPLVSGGSAAVVVATPERGEVLARKRRAVHVAPVFSTLGVPERVARQPRRERPPVVGVLNYTGDGARPDIVLRGLALLPPASRPSLLLLGWPGPDHPATRPWLAMAAEEGVGEHISFTGVLPAADLRALIEGCAVVVLPYEHGPSGRRTTLAAALAHGVPTLAFDGAETWAALVDADAVALSRQDPRSFADALARLVGSPERQQQLSGNGRAFYERTMAVELLGELVAGLLSGCSAPDGASSAAAADRRSSQPSTSQGSGATE
jgi:glycosyltransferase involved in cell wall biosynthesis